MLIYAFLFAAGFANESLLTAYYVCAAEGRRWRCVLLSLAQQVVSIASTLYTLVDVEPGSREQMIRWVVVALSYVAASAWIVKPKQKEGHHAT